MAGWRGGWAERGIWTAVQVVAVETAEHNLTVLNVNISCNAGVNGAQASFCQRRSQQIIRRVVRNDEGLLLLKDDHGCGGCRCWTR